MSVEALSSLLEPIDIPLEQIFLDPNNPRFGEIDTPFVPDDEIFQEHHQAKAKSRLLREFAADKLVLNMEVNGYLPIDRIIVRRVANAQYVTLEGNRRIAAAKTISKYDAQGNKLNDAVMSTFSIIPCLLYTGNEKNASWIFQGLRHITGINDWSAYNKARLLVEQIQEEGLSYTDVGRRFGLTRYGAGQWARGYFAYKQAKEETDYVREIDERIYPYFQELFGRSSVKLKEWLEWDDDRRSFARVDNLNEYVSWFYPRKADQDGAAGEETALGNWDMRIIGKRDDLRQLAYLIASSPKNFQYFRENFDLEASYGRAIVDEMETRAKKDENTEKLIGDSVENCIAALNNTPVSIIKNKQKMEELLDKIAKLQEAINFLKS